MRSFSYEYDGGTGNRIITSGDGSATLYSDRFGESYRSSGGAAAESLHVFVRGGLLRYCTENPAEKTIRILEYGFGTGMNAMSTIMHAPETDIEYTSLDLFPLREQEYSGILPENASEEIRTLFRSIHTAEWCTPADCRYTEIRKNFRLRKILCDFRTFNPLNASDGRPWINVVYFDPFSPSSEPECWEENIFRSLILAAKPGAILATYSAKGDVKRALRSAGWEVHRVPGTGTKRHNLIAENRL